MASSSDISKRARILSEFTMFSRIRRDNTESLKLSIIDLEEENYVINANNRKLPFKILSDENLSDFDKKVLQTESRKKHSVFRSLRLMFSMPLVSPKLIVGCCSDRVFKTLISYTKNNTDYVIDYSNNVIMKQSDYYELFSFKELNVLDQVDIYFIYVYIRENKDYKNIEYYLLDSDIYLKNCPRKGYASNGVNMRNCLLFGDWSDSVFISPVDSRNVLKTIVNLDSFTLEPEKENKHVTYDNSLNKYCYEDEIFGAIYFDLLSNFVQEDEIKEKLLSESRYSECHMNSQFIASYLGQNSKVVAGKIKMGHNFYLLHSWVEIDEINVVVDYNHNLVMNKDVYYKLFGAISINKTTVNELISYLDELNSKLDLKLDSYMFNYFGQELHRDISKNKQLLIK